MSSNAIERFWSARRQSLWDEVAALLRPGVRISLPHQGREPSRDEFLTMLHLVHAPGSETKVERVITGRGLDIAVSATVRRPDGVLQCSGFYELQAGLIERIEESWIVPGTGRFDLATVGARRAVDQ